MKENKNLDYILTIIFMVWLISTFFTFIAFFKTTGFGNAIGLSIISGASIIAFSILVLKKK